MKHIIFLLVIQPASGEKLHLHSLHKITSSVVLMVCLLSFIEKEGQLWFTKQREDPCWSTTCLYPAKPKPPLVSIL